MDDADAADEDVAPEALLRAAGTCLHDLADARLLPLLADDVEQCLDNVVRLAVERIGGTSFDELQFAECQRSLVRVLGPWSEHLKRGTPRGRTCSAALLALTGAPMLGPPDPMDATRQPGPTVTRPGRRCKVASPVSLASSGAGFDRLGAADDGRAVLTMAGCQCFFCSAYGARRIDQLFDIMADYPESLPAVRDLKVGRPPFPPPPDAVAAFPTARSSVAPRTGATAAAPDLHGDCTAQERTGHVPVPVVPTPPAPSRRIHGQHPAAVRRHRQGAANARPLRHLP